MTICLSCYHCWPESAIYCGSCQRTFQGRRCPHAHLSPKDARYCIECGTSDLSVPTKWITTGWVCRLAAWMVAFCFLKPLLILIGKLCLGILAVCLLMSLLLRLLFGRSGVVGGLIGPLLIGHLLFRLIGLFFRGLGYLIQGHSQPAPAVPRPRRLPI